MAITRSTCRKAANPSHHHAQPLAKRAISSKEVIKLQQLLKNMDLNKRSRTSRDRKARKKASRPAVDLIPGFQAPKHSANTSSTLLSVDFESLPPPSHVVCAASLGAPVPTSSPADIPADIQSTPSNTHPQTTLQVPLPPWMSTPPISQYTLEGFISELEGFSIDQHLATPDEATSPAITTRWLPPAPAAEEPEDCSYDMSILQDALDDCGKTQTNEYIHLGYHPEPRPRIAYHHPVVDYSSCLYAPPSLEVGKVKTVRRYKATCVPYSHEPALRKKRRCSSDSDRSEGQACLGNIPEAVAALPYSSLRRARTVTPPSYEQPPPVSDPNFPYGSDYWA